MSIKELWTIRRKCQYLDLTNEKKTVKYVRTAYKPYQERWRERPDETRQPAKAWCQIRRQTTDEDSIDTHIESSVCAFLFWANFWIVFPPDSGSFALQLRLKSFEIHKVFLQLFALLQAKILHWQMENPILQARQLFWRYERTRITNGKKTVYFWMRDLRPSR